MAGLLLVIPRARTQQTGYGYDEDNEQKQASPRPYGAIAERRMLPEVVFIA